MDYILYSDCLVQSCLKCISWSARHELHGSWSLQWHESDPHMPFQLFLLLLCSSIHGSLDPHQLVQGLPQQTVPSHTSKFCSWSCLCLLLEIPLCAHFHIFHTRLSFIHSLCAFIYEICLLTGNILCPHTLNLMNTSLISEPNSSDYKV